MKLVDEKLQIYDKKFSKKEFVNAVNRKEKMWEIDLKNLIIGNLSEFNKAKKELFGKI